MMIGNDWQLDHRLVWASQLLRTLRPDYQSVHVQVSLECLFPVGPPYNTDEATLVLLRTQQHYGPATD